MSDLPRRILLVEDTRELAQVIARELEAAGYHVFRAADGRTALDLHARERVDLIVLDWMLPGLSGLDVLRQVRQTAATPVLMLTARGEEADRVIGLELGADDYLGKPFSMRELIARVRALLRRDELIRQAISADRQPATGVTTFGPLHLDPERHLARLNGDPLELTPNEFALLQLLVRNPGRAVSRSYLIDSVWARATSPATAPSTTPSSRSQPRHQRGPPYSSRRPGPRQRRAGRGHPNHPGPRYRRRHRRYRFAADLGSVLPRRQRSERKRRRTRPGPGARAGRSHGRRRHRGQHHRRRQLLHHPAPACHLPRSRTRDTLIISTSPPRLPCSRGRTLTRASGGCRAQPHAGLRANPARAPRGKPATGLRPSRDQPTTALA
ncbi:MAG: response regulator transcription factor [Chloroflexota bacterium]|nr:response regulator transcription factor [Chloroflexota bacterium]